MKLYMGLGLALLLSLAAYLNSVGASFQYDDFHSIVNNPHITRLGNIPGFFHDVSAGSGEKAGYGGYRPVVTATLALNYAVSGLDTWSYHAFNMAAHLLTVAVVFFLALSFAKGAGVSPYLAVLAAAIFGLHPAETNAVTYIIARSAVLCTLFYLFSFYACVRFRESGKRPWLMASLISFPFALLSKELAVTLPVMMLLYELIALKGWERRPRYIYLLPFAVIDLVYILARYSIVVHAGQVQGLGSTGPRLLAQPGIILGYIRLFIFPTNLNFYPDPPRPVSFADPAFLIPLALVLAALAGIAYLSRRHGNLAFCLAWFFVALIPETLANLRELMVEYRLYLPSVGLALILSMAPVRVTTLERRKALAFFGLGTAVIACFFVLTVVRNGVYKDKLTLWEDTVRKSPRSAVANASLGSYYLDVNRLADAAKYLEHAFSLDPNMPEAAESYNNLGMALQYTGQYERALAAYQSGLRIKPRDIKLLINTGLTYYRLGKGELALAYIGKAVESEPENPIPRQALREVEEALKKTKR